MAMAMETPTPTFILLTIEGNIGSGKSTTLEELKNHYKGNKNVVFAPEPVSEWEKIKDKNGVTMLEKFYSNQLKYAFGFQMMKYLSRLKILRATLRENVNKPIIIITEHSLYTDKYIFAKMLYDQGKIEDVDYQIYLNWFDEFAQDFPIHYCIYIKANPEICHQRIQKRGRVGEDVIPLEYLTSCHEYHEEYIKQFSKLLTLNGNEDVYKDPLILEQWMNKIDSIIAGFSPRATDL